MADLSGRGVSPRDFGGGAATFRHSQREDIEICEAVQRGLRSRTHQKGRYSVQRENGPHHFPGLLSRFLL